MRQRSIRRRWVQAGLVGLAALDGVSHAVVDVQDDQLGAEIGVLLDVPLDDGEGLQDVVHVVALGAVEVDVGGVELATQPEPPVLVPAERRAVVAGVFREGL